MHELFSFHHILLSHIVFIEGC